MNYIRSQPQNADEKKLSTIGAIAG